MAEAVVDVLEVVEIEVQDGECGVAAAGSFDGLAELDHEKATVAEAGEDVVVGAMFELLIESDLGGDVVLDADEVGDETVAIADGRHVEFVPEEGAIFAIVSEDGTDVGAFAERFADGHDFWLIEVVALEESAVATVDFCCRVAGHALEGRVDVGEGKVGEIGVGDGDSVADGVDDEATTLEIGE